MATNEILPFASTNTGTNLLTQAEYSADSQRVIGHQPGIARSKLENKVLRQASTIAAGLAEFIADWQANNVTDGLTPQQVADYLLAALAAAFPKATETVQGKIELATLAESLAGVDAQRAITPATMWAAFPFIVPAGTVLFVAQATAPSGYIKANGALLSRTTYDKLFAAIGTTFGSGDGSTTFQIPDLRGEFLRGLDDGRGVDAGRALGSTQAGDNAAHTHAGSSGSAGNHSHTGSTDWTGSHNHVNGAFRNLLRPPYVGSVTGSDTTNSGGEQAVGPGDSAAMADAGGHSHSVTVGSAGDHSHAVTIGSSGSEARPRNIALLACIKY